MSFGSHQFMLVRFKIILLFYLLKVFPGSALGEDTYVRTERPNQLRIAKESNRNICEYCEHFRERKIATTNILPNVRF